MVLKNLTQDEIETYISLLELVRKIVSKYDGDDLYRVGVGGLEKGLQTYLQKKRYKESYKASTYLSWFIKTAIEAHLGIENEDTTAWNCRNQIK